MNWKRVVALISVWKKVSSIFDYAEVRVEIGLKWQSLFVRLQRRFQLQLETGLHAIFLHFVFINNYVADALRSENDRL